MKVRYGEGLQKLTLIGAMTAIEKLTKRLPIK